LCGLFIFEESGCRRVNALIEKHEDITLMRLRLRHSVDRVIAESPPLLKPSLLLIALRLRR
jgi:hypothetical protein